MVRSYTLIPYCIQNEKCRPATGLSDLCLIHDNASAHKYVLVQDFLKDEKVVQLSHPPYSPDLSPCDFFPVSFTKETLSGLVVVMSLEVHLSLQLTSVFRVFLKKAYFSAFTEWISRLEKCVTVKGEYVEGLKLMQWE